MRHALACGPSATSLVLAITGSLSSLGCSEQFPSTLPVDVAQQYAEAYCNAVVECDCPTQAHTDMGSCVEKVKHEFQAILDRFGDHRLNTYCYYTKIDTLINDPCYDYRPGNPAPYCDLFKGDVGLGQPCNRDIRSYPFDSSDCKDRDARCQGEAPGAGFCVNDEIGYLSNIEEGEKCGWSVERCEWGLYCDNSELVCKAGAALGESCFEPAGCDYYGENSYCHGLHNEGDVGVCERQIGPDQPCDVRDYWPCSLVNGQPHACINGTCQLWKLITVCHNEFLRSESLARTGEP